MRVVFATTLFVCIAVDAESAVLPNEHEATLATVIRNLKTFVADSLTEGEHTDLSLIDLTSTAEQLVAEYRQAVAAATAMEEKIAAFLELKKIASQLDTFSQSELELIDTDLGNNHVLNGLGILVKLNTDVKERLRRSRITTTTTTTTTTSPVTTGEVPRNKEACEAGIGRADWVLVASVILLAGALALSLLMKFLNR
jgi:hypothetical protein